MKRNKIIESIKIDEFSATPKYQQLVNAVVTAIRNGVVKKGDSMPSINELSFECQISRLTIEKGYNVLRTMGILEAFRGKGYFVARTDVAQDLKILLMFNKLSAHKKIIYDSFVQTLGDKAAIDFYIYNNDFTLFQQLLNRQKENYTHYVIIPHFIENTSDFKLLINSLPKEKLVIVGKKIEEITGDYSAVFESFEENIFDALVSAESLLRKYNTLKMVFPEGSYFPDEIVTGFTKFCKVYDFNFKVVADMDQEAIKEGEVYINLREEDLVKILDKVINLNFVIGNHVGLISYNETPLKKFILNGLTTISTDFEKMGITAAQLVLNGSKDHIKNPFNLVIRGSM